MFEFTKSFSQIFFIQYYSRHQRCLWEPFPLCVIFFFCATVPLTQVLTSIHTGTGTSTTAIFSVTPFANHRNNFEICTMHLSASHAYCLLQLTQFGTDFNIVQHFFAKAAYTTRIDGFSLLFCYSTVFGLVFEPSIKSFHSSGMYVIFRSSNKLGMSIKNAMSPSVLK